MLSVDHSRWKAPIRQTDVRPIAFGIGDRRQRCQAWKAHFFAWVCVAILIPGDFSLLAQNRTAPEKSALDDSASREQDLLVLGPLEPIRLRLLIEIDGVPFRKVWQNTFDRVFDQFDVDRDGRLTSDQARQVTTIFVPTSTSTVPAGSSAKSAEMTVDTIARLELRSRIELVAPPLTLRQQLSSSGAGPALVPLLDIDGDGRLSRDELNLAEQSLHCRDFNDDQLIIEQELLAGPSLSSADNAEENGVNNGSVILLTKSIDAKAIAEILLARYDRNRDGVLSLLTPAEILSTDGRLAALDRDGSKSLDREELGRILDNPLDATLPFNLGGSNGASQTSAEALPQYRLRSKKSDGGFRLHVGTSEINFRRNNRDPSQDNLRPHMQDFDPDGNKYLDEAEFANVPDHPDFAVIDTDKDGKIIEAEFDAFFRQRSNASSVQLVLEVSDKGSDLFTALDRNFDRVLTPRELHQAAKLLETEDRDGDGYLGGVEMSYNLVLELSRGGSRPTVNNNALVRGSTEPQVKAYKDGPSWFTKMDRNRDGDVSLSEFAGSREIFQSLDRDADGLISPDESTAFQKTP